MSLKCDCIGEGDETLGATVRVRAQEVILLKVTLQMLIVPKVLILAAGTFAQEAGLVLGVQMMEELLVAVEAHLAELAERMSAALHGAVAAVLVLAQLLRRVERLVAEPLVPMLDAESAVAQPMLAVQMPVERRARLAVLGAARAHKAVGSHTHLAEEALVVRVHGPAGLAVHLLQIVVLEGTGRMRGHHQHIQWPLAHAAVHLVAQQTDLEHTERTDLAVIAATDRVVRDRLQTHQTVGGLLLCGSRCDRSVGLLLRGRSRRRSSNSSSSSSSRRNRGGGGGRARCGSSL
mmetsp:Transcript_3663/g.11387  ORF Transcript_3663/g.11387 Transcript_3663/m.11387 type:complete len:291 (-) Transcript_3663:464-1336(-)